MELKEYFSPLLKWWWLIVLATAVAGTTSYFATRQQPQYYRSTATLVVGSAIENPNPTSGDIYLTQQLASFYVDMANRSTVREDTMEALGLNWLPEIYVRNVDNLIDIIVTDTNPQRAQAVASELTEQLILRSPTAQQRDVERRQFINRQLDSYEATITDTQIEIAEKQEELTTLTSAREIADLQEEIANLEGSLDSLETNYTRLLASTQEGATNSISVIEPATLPTSPIDNNRIITILTAAGIGFVLSASAAYLLEYLDDRIRTPEQIRRIADLPTLAGIAQIKGEDTSLVTVRRPRAPVSEAFRVLRTNIQFTNVDHPYRSLLITSAMPLEGKSATISNLGVVLAQAGHNVLLIDADLRRPSQHVIFDVPNRRGLTDLLVAFEPYQSEAERSARLAELAHATQVENLTVLPSGPPPPNPSELLGSDKMAHLIEALLEQFDYILFDSPPVLSVTDAAVLGTIVDGTVLVVRAGKSRKGLLERSVEQLGDVHANLIGTVLNGLPPNSEGFSAYYYYRDPYYNEMVDADEDSSGSSGEQKKTPKWRERFSSQERSEPDPIGQQ